MNYAQIRKFDVTNGPFVRSTLFVSGCTHKCKGCFNNEQQDFNYGDKFTKETEEDFIKATLNPRIKGISILGGEPFQQLYDNTLLELFTRIKREVQKPLWVWTGYTFEKLLEDPKKIELLKFVDVLIDGQFQLENRDLSLKYRGSSNQRVIDVQKSLKENQIIEFIIN